MKKKTLSYVSNNEDRSSIMSKVIPCPLLTGQLTLEDLTLPSLPLLSCAFVWAANAQLKSQIEALVIKKLTGCVLCDSD